MNHLAHLFLSTEDPHHRAGAFAADLVKGRLDGRFPEGLAAGLRQHRRVDAFVDRHQAMDLLRSSLEPRFRRYADVLFDVAADRILALEWGKWSAISFEAFSRGVYRDLSAPQPFLPASFAALCDRFRQRDGLSWTTEPEYVSRTLRFLSGRMRRENPLGEAAIEIDRCQGLFEQTFEVVWPDTVRFVREMDQAAAPFAKILIAP